MEDGVLMSTSVLMFSFNPFYAGLIALILLMLYTSINCFGEYFSRKAEIERLESMGINPLPSIFKEKLRYLFFGKLCTVTFFCLLLVLICTVTEK